MVIPVARAHFFLPLKLSFVQDITRLYHQIFFLKIIFVLVGVMLVFSEIQCLRFLLTISNNYENDYKCEYILDKYIT